MHVPTVPVPASALSDEDERAAIVAAVVGAPRHVYLRPADAFAARCGCLANAAICSSSRPQPHIELAAAEVPPCEVAHELGALGVGLVNAQVRPPSQSNAG